jgi:CobQ/CobB/MinD/ParA family nucleotide binding protein
MASFLGLHVFHVYDVHGAWLSSIRSARSSARGSGLRLMVLAKGRSNRAHRRRDERKGGSGKTTTTISLAAVLAERGLPVPVVDLDPQASASLWIGRGREPGLFRAITDRADLRRTFYRRPCRELTSSPPVENLRRSTIVLNRLPATGRRLRGNFSNQAARSPSGKGDSRYRIRPTDQSGPAGLRHEAFER